MLEYMEKFRLDGRTAFVVGGLGLIGKEVSSALASAGAKIVVLDIADKIGHEFSTTMNSQGYDVNYYHFNCAEMTNLDKNFEILKNEFGCPNIFMNCTYPRTDDWGSGSFKNASLKSFRTNVDIHMNSYSWLARLAAEAMVRLGEGGSVIQTGSNYGVVGQDLTVYEGTEMHEQMIYAAIKGGITNLTRLMASYYGEHNIRVNTLCPGGLVGHVHGKSSTQNPVFVENYSKKTPLKRLGKPEEIASAALFLASDAASYITGTTFMVDGGWTAI